MTDTTQPDTAVESPDAGTLESTFENLFAGQPEAEKQKAPAAPEAASEAEPPEGADPELPEFEDDDAPKEAATDAAAFEIVHNGQTVKLSREQVIENAQKGFDYDRKTQAVAETQRQYSTGLQRMAELEQVQPLLVQEMGQVAALQQRLGEDRYSDQELLKLAYDDPFEHSKRVAERDILRNAYQSAAGQFQQKAQAVQQYKSQLQAFQLQQENARLPEVIPQWANPEKRAHDEIAMSKYLDSYGIDRSQVGRYLDNAVAMKMVRQSMLYEQAQKANKSKQAKAAPPVIRPGANAASDAGKTSFAKARTNLRIAGAKGDHRTQERIAEAMFSRTFKV